MALFLDTGELWLFPCDLLMSGFIANNADAGHIPTA
jgi:hypothetical protein